MSDQFPSLPAEFLPGDGRFGCGPSKVRPSQIQAVVNGATGIMGTSHRQPAVKNVVGEVREGLSDLFSLPDGYDTVVGERGSRLSGGQKQRVAIARVFLKDPAILILDEATSALDNESEEAVQESLERLAQDRTTIIIAHRLSTISNVDTIVTLDQGRVGEVGSPAELAVSGGIYAELLKLTASASAADRKRLKQFGLEV